MSFALELMKYQQIVPLIEALELKWQSTLRAISTNPDLLIANGQVQFFDIENTPAKAEHDEPGINEPERAVVVAVGINYWQNLHRHGWCTPCLGRNPNGSPIAVSSDLPSAMRNHLDQTFAKYVNHPKDWVDRCLASDAGIPVKPVDLQNGYILIATNFSPLITFKPWQEYDPQYRANLLRLFRGGCDYLDDLRTALTAGGINIAVWVGHGLGSEVPVLFGKWQAPHDLAPWIVTSNLGRRLPTGHNVFYVRACFKKHFSPSLG